MKATKKEQVRTLRTSEVIWG